MCTVQPRKSAEDLYEKVQKHRVYIGSASPAFVSEYKANFTWPPLSAYPTLIPVAKAPTETVAATTEETAATVETLKSAETKTSESGEQGKQSLSYASCKRS